MSRLRVVPIVEGHGEVESVRLLLERIHYEIAEGEGIEVLRPIRRPRSKFVRHGEAAVDRSEIVAALSLAELRLRERRDGTREWVLLLLDANGDLPCVLAPALIAVAREEMDHLDFSCVLAAEEYETWFVAAAESLGEFIDLSRTPGVPADPEASGSKKAWIGQRMAGRYSETVDQPALTAAMDLGMCRRRSPSFDKLCREVEARR